MITDLDNLVRLGKAQIKPASEMFAKAFQDYPLFCYLIPDASERLVKLKYIFESIIRYGDYYGEVYATSSNLEGVAVWLPSEKGVISLWRIIRSMGLFWLRNYFKVGEEAFSRMMSFFEFANVIHKRHAAIRHLHLWLIGVDPELQGKGYASSLLKPMFDKLDQEQMPCYLETHDETLIDMYKHYGFEVVDRNAIPGTRIRNWAMLREITSK